MWIQFGANSLKSNDMNSNDMNSFNLNKVYAYCEALSCDIEALILKYKLIKTDSLLTLF